MRRLFSVIFAFVLFCNIFSVVYAVDPTPIPPLPCSIDPRLGSCPSGISTIYTSSKFYKGEKCVTDYTEFSKNPLMNHYWSLDEQTTSQGKANERARQFLYWTLSKSAIDQHPAIRQIWSVTQNISIFLFLIVAALFGLGYIVGQKSNFQLKLQIWPTIMKIATGLLYIVFSYAITMAIIQISEIFMKFFIEVLGGNKLFNIYFTSTQSKEDNYALFVGCRDLNYKVQEAIQSEFVLMKITNITYYVMGGMLLLRKILLWFLIFVSPFLALLMPFVFIRNIAWVWVGVFFQWVFYGPLFALFLSALTKLWKSGIPFGFDFSRVGQVSGYIYPTGINIVYGGPAQVSNQIISFLNNGNYVDTFTEYVISLIMLWAVIFFPWWLLRIFRDYCCEGIAAMKNVLMSMYDKMATSPQSPKGPSSPSPTFTKSSMNIKKEMDVPIKVRLETVEDIKRTKTEDITKTLNLSMNKITDVARFETNKQTNETVRKNLQFLSQPTQASTPIERQKFMNIRTELFNRTIKEDKVAKQILSSISNSQYEQTNRREEILRTVPHASPINQAASYRVNITGEKLNAVNSSYVTSITNSPSIMQTISQTTKAAPQQIQAVLSSYKSNLIHAPGRVVSSIVKETGVASETVASIIKALADAAKKNKDLVKKVAEKEQVKEDDVEKVLSTQAALATEPEKNIEQSVTIPPSVSIEDYEEVKKMWSSQYEKGEVPVSENITSRAQWVEQDVVFITNTLNKLLSTDEKLRQEGVDDLGYILPIFLINSLKGEELVVYLKAKVEAAKTVKQNMEKEKEITDKLKQKSEEELVEIEKPKAATEEKHLEMSQEMPTEETTPGSTPEKTESNPETPQTK